MNHTRALVETLRKGDRINDGIYLLDSYNFKQTRDQKYFLQMVLRDRTGAVRAVRWEATRQMFREFSAGDFARVEGRVEEYQGNLQVIVDQLGRVRDDEVDVADFLPTCARPIAEMENELSAHVEAVTEPHLKALLQELLADDRIRERLTRAPAGKAIHHAYIGGLLEHTLSLIGAIKSLATHYQNLDVDVMVCAAVLHDLGKIDELTYERNFDYSDRGQLVGHIGIGLVLLAQKVRSLPNFPVPLHVHLEHIIVSHHGVPEHGALKRPMTPEALAFHLLDNLDAKLGMLDSLDRDIGPDARRSETGGRWSEYLPSMGHKMYFPS